MALKQMHGAHSVTSIQNAAAQNFQMGLVNLAENKY